MKKLIASTIIILPLLLLAILLVSGAILSLITYTYVETVEFTKKDAVVLLMDDEDNLPTYSLMEEIRVTPVNAKNRSFKFESSNKEVATVDEDGVVTPVYYGETYISVTSDENKAAVAKRKVIVTGTTIDNFVLNNLPEDGKMEVGEKRQLSVSIFPIDAMNKAQEWKSDNPEVLKVNANGTVTAVGVGQATITVTSKGNEEISKTATIRCVPRTQDGFKVFCEGAAIESGKAYKTILDNLTFSAFNGSKAVSYQTTTSSGWHTVTDGKILVDSAQDREISFKSGEETVTFTLEKVAFESFGVDIFATLDTENGAQVEMLETVEKEDVQNKERIERPLSLAKRVQDCFTLQVNLGEEFLGGFGSDENFEELLAVDFGMAEGYGVSYDAVNSQIIVSFPGKEGFEQDISLKSDEKEIVWNLNRITISRVAFTNEAQSFDSANTVDFRKGLQQVSVYAKHSFYGIGEEGKKVDYFKIPFKAFTDVVGQTQATPDTVNWRLARFVGDEEERVLTYQVGDTVTFDDKEFKIVKDGEEYVLKDAQNLDGEAVSGKDGLNGGGIIWVDAFTEPGFARIYFGNFAGLSESDVYNDYFGNFEENETWKVPEKATDTKNVENEEGKGAVVDPSANAYTFLRVQAGDGAVGGVNCHFNFNVLDDDELVNVFNATGYYANSKIVLQNSLYGPGELHKATDKADELNEDEQNAIANDLVLTKTVEAEKEGEDARGKHDLNVLGKNTIYGNGYSINFEVKNAQIKELKPDSENYSIYVRVDRMYNLTLQGCNKQEEVNIKLQKLVLRFEYAYYCDIMSYSKGGVISADRPTVIKNCVMRYAAHSALQLYSSYKGDPDGYYGERAYLENVSIVECMLGLAQEMDGGAVARMHYYMKGQVDILSYSNGLNLFRKLHVDESYADMISLLLMCDQTLNNQFEYFGSREPNESPKYTRFVNMVLYSGQPYTDDDAMFCWDDATNSYSNKISPTTTPFKKVEFGYIAEANVAELKKLAVINYSDVAKDGINANGARSDFKKLFTDEQRIRLLCQYVDQEGQEDAKVNTEHIRWHMEEVYRDPSLIEGRIGDHIEHLKSTLIGKGIEWHDGKTPEDAIEQSTEVTNQVAILPERKRELATSC